MDDKQALLREIFEAHRQISNLARSLRELAADVEYLHPRMAEDLIGMVSALNGANRTIQNNHAAILNADLKASQDFTSNIMAELLKKATSGEGGK